MINNGLVVTLKGKKGVVGGGIRIRDSNEKTEYQKEDPNGRSSLKIRLPPLSHKTRGLDQESSGDSTK